MNDVISHHMTDKIELNKKIELTHILNINTSLISHDQIRDSNNSSFNAEKDKSDSTSKNEEDKKNDEIIKDNEIDSIDEEEDNLVKK